LLNIGVNLIFFTGYSFLVIPLLVFLVLLTNKLDESIRISYFSASTPLFLTFATLIMASFGARGGTNRLRHNDNHIPEFILIQMPAKHVFLHF